MKKIKKYCLTCKTNEVYENYQQDCWDCEHKFKKKMFNLSKVQKEERAKNMTKNKEKNLMTRLKTKRNKLIDSLNG